MQSDNDDEAQLIHPFTHICLSVYEHYPQNDEITLKEECLVPSP